MDIPEQTFLDLEAGSEWRFELEGDENIAVRVSRWSSVCIQVAVLEENFWASTLHVR